MTKHSFTKPKRLTRFIGLRVTEEQYKLLCEVAAADGYSTLSDVAREALNNYLRRRSRCTRSS